MSLAKQLMKAGLVSKKQAKQAGHQKRVTGKSQGTHQKEQEAREQQRRFEQEKARQREKDRLLQARLNAERKETELALKAQQIRTAAIAKAYDLGRVEHWNGSRAYYFNNQGLVDCLFVTEDAAAGLEAGAIAIVTEDGATHQPTLLRAGSARTLRELAPDLVWTLHE